MSDKAATVAHYGAIAEELKNPTTHRMLIEITSLDPGTDLSACTFEHIKLTSGSDKRFVTKLVGRHMQTVGLWRIVPENVDG